jgi:hypothetical protein
VRKKFFIIFLFLVLLTAGWIFFSNQNPVSGFIHQYVENGEFITFKARFTPEQIMESHQKELLVDDRHLYQEAGLRFHPYLLMDVKYSQQEKKSREGVVLWSLVNGEMVLNTETWEQTHGFEDAINVDASREDFKVMLALAKNKGSSSLEQLQKELHVEKEPLHAWINSAMRKQLVIQKGSEFQLHFQDPKILVQPQTKINDWPVKKPYNYAQRISRKYSAPQVQKIAKAGFGEDFTIRTVTEVFLPVYSIEVLNPDGSIHTSYWNALNGQRMPLRYSLY